jgi:hypothetical protein
MTRASVRLSASADTEGTAEGAARALQTVVQSSGAQVVVGPLTTGEVVGNDGERVQKMLPFIANHYIGTAMQTYLDENGDQAVVYYSIQQVTEDGTEFTEIGSYDGSSNTVTLE